jgi:hypothetical protein
VKVLQQVPLSARPGAGDPREEQRQGEGIPGAAQQMRGLDRWETPNPRIDPTHRASMRCPWAVRMGGSALGAQGEDWCATVWTLGPWRGPRARLGSRPGLGGIHPSVPRPPISSARALGAERAARFCYACTRTETHAREGRHPEVATGGVR